MGSPNQTVFLFIYLFTFLNQAESSSYIHGFSSVRHLLSAARQPGANALSLLQLGSQWEKLEVALGFRLKGSHLLSKEKAQNPILVILLNCCF